RTPDDMLRAFADRPDAIKNTLAIAEKCNLEIPLGLNLLPHFPTPNKMPAAEYLRELCIKGLEQRYTEKQKKGAYERLEYELKIISQMGFDDYFLIVWDFINYARQNGIVVGPGRGSAAGSIIAYTLGITALDPLQYGLLFERFLNPERISMPDIDIDFADHRRDEIIQYVKQKYGELNVAQVVTFGTMAAKSAVRDVGRAMGYPYSEVDLIAKKMPQPVLGKHAPLQESVVNFPELKLEYETNKRAKALLDNAMKLEGTIRHAGTHACAVIIAEKELTTYTPLQFASGKDGTMVTQYSMKPLEEIGLLKMDFLGLRNLTILENALVIIKERHDVDIDLTKIPMDDEKAFTLLSEGKTTGVFQLESGGMKRYLKELKPTQLEDIIAMNALYRPGPMDYIPDYIRGKHKSETVKYMHPSFEGILKETYGVCVYQEQLLEIAKVFAGFSLGEADILRKAVGKKDPQLLAEQRQKFVDSAMKQGQEEAFAKQIFIDVIEPFAGYGFNKSHAACYAMISYQTAYLKAHYPTEFMAALLTSDQGNTDRVVIDLMECDVMGVKVLPPNVNESNVNFTVVEDGVIRFGLAAIKGVGEASVQEIITARDKAGPYKGLEDFSKRVPRKLLNKKTLEALAYSGSLDEFGDRLQMAEGYEVISSFAKAEQDQTSEGQLDIFGMMVDDDGSKPKGASLNLPEVTKPTDFQLLKWEKQYLGLYVSSHPLKGLGAYFRHKANLICDLGPKKNGEDVTVGGLVTECKKIITKRGDAMMIIKIEDPSGVIEAIAFPRVYTQMINVLVEDKLVFITGKLEERREKQLVMREAKAVSLAQLKQRAEDEGLYDPNEILVFGDSAPGLMDGTDPLFQLYIPHLTDPSRLNSLKKLIKDNPGETPVELQLQDAENNIQKMRLKGGVALTPELKAALEGCLG
ncbi:DNA polymerase III subunit alpha, partial [Candidatus Peregrinibacteria bacterium CG_4_10_14_0_2_um_filter_41_8]